LSEGSFVNGSSLIKGIENKIDSSISILEESVLMTLDLKNTSLLQRESKRRRSDFNWFYGTTLEVSFPAFVDGPLVQNG
jgi:hypothetical protein